MKFADLIQLVADTSRKLVYYTVQLIEFPPIQVFTDYSGKYRNKLSSNNVMYFFSSDEAIQFLSDKELWGWEIKSWDIRSEWNHTKEMRIVLYRVRGN